MLSPDSDALIFGAKKIIKRDTTRTKKRKKKIYFLYDLKKLKSKHKLSQNDLIKVALCLGTDFNPKGVKGIGEKTVLSKYKIIDNMIKVNEDIRKAYAQFKKECPLDIKTIHNRNNKILNDKQKINDLLDWVEHEKNYNRERIEKLIQNAIKHHFCEAKMRVYDNNRKSVKDIIIKKKVKISSQKNN